jgi:hypothetical protein
MLQSARSIVLNPGADQPRNDAVSKGGQGASFNAVNWTGGISVLANPALASLFNPTPLDARAVQVKAAIDSAVRRLTTETPTLVTPGVAVVNCLGDGEKPVINLTGWCVRKTLSWSDIEPFRSQDATELAEVAKRLTERLGVPCDSTNALAIIVERMKTLLRESVLYGIAQEEAQIIADKIGSREQRLGRWLLHFIPGEEATDAALRASLTEAKERKQRHASLHGGDYAVCGRRAGIAVMRQQFDSLLFYSQGRSDDGIVTLQPTDNHPWQAIRINSLSIGLAQLGIFQKGNCDWDQHYPTSPLQFFQDHVERYLTVNLPRFD